DRDGLVEWVWERLPLRGSIFLVHGEDPAREGLRDALTAGGLSLPGIVLPKLDDVVALECGKCAANVTAPTRLTGDMARGLDWHNDYAAAMIDIGKVVNSLGSDEARHAFLDKLREVIGEAEVGAGHSRQ